MGMLKQFAIGLCCLVQLTQSLEEDRSIRGSPIGYPKIVVIHDSNRYVLSRLQGTGSTPRHGGAPYIWQALFRGTETVRIEVVEEKAQWKVYKTSYSNVDPKKVTTELYRFPYTQDILRPYSPRDRDQRDIDQRDIIRRPNDQDIDQREREI